MMISIRSIAIITLDASNIPSDGKHTGLITRQNQADPIMPLHSLDSFAALSRLLESPHTAAGSIRKACIAVEDCISSNRDNLRAFFETCFASLLKRVFGYDFEASWLNAVTKAGREQDAAALLALLSPTGRLMTAIHNADNDKLVQFSFPLERLPVHTQELLKSAAGRQELDKWPQYAGHIATDVNGHTQILLNVFEYFMFWNAFFVLRGGRSASEPSSRYSQPTTDTFGRQDSSSWAVPVSFSDIKRTFISGFHASSSASLDNHPYFILLQQYLSHYLPQGVSPAQSLAFAFSGSQAYGSLYNAMAAQALQGSAIPGAVLLSILVEFWMTDVAEPVPQTTKDTSAVTAASPTLRGGQNGSMSPATPITPTISQPGLTSPTHPSQQQTGTPLRVMAYQPPSDEVLMGISLLVQHMHVVKEAQSGNQNRQGASQQPGSSRAQRVVAKPAQSGTPWLVETPVRTVTYAVGQRSPPIPPPVAVLGGPASPAVQAVSRKVYRLLRRTIAQWPLASGASLAPVINLWLSVITPWNIHVLHDSAARGFIPTPHTSPASPRSSHKLQWPEGMSHLGSEISKLTHLGKSSTPDNRQQDASQGQGYSSEWRGHVLSHLPFYNILIPRFLELALARLSYRGNAAGSELLLFLRGLAAAGPDLMRLLEDVELAYNRFTDSGKKRLSGPLAECLPWIAEQILDWEAAAIAGAPCNPPLQVDTEYRLFTLGPNSAASFGSAILRASQAQVRAELREAIAQAMQRVIPVEHLQDSGQVPVMQTLEATQGVQYPKAGRWAAVRYKGDQMSRPIASNEIGFLVRFTVYLSQIFNRWTGLDVPWQGDDEEPPETIIQQGINWLRKHDRRINLRFLAEVQVLGWIILLLSSWFWLSKFFSHLFSSPPPDTGSELATVPYTRIRQHTM